MNSDLIYDWNKLSGPDAKPTRPVLLNDESLRDGLQSPSVRDPSITEKIEILHLMEALGINALDIGLPGAGPRAGLNPRGRPTVTMPEDAFGQARDGTPIPGRIRASRKARRARRSRHQQVITDRTVFRQLGPAGFARLEMSFQRGDIFRIQCAKSVRRKVFL